jgi:L-iditol 2-dehydrogenase
MKALVKVARGYGKLELREVPRPEVGPDDVLMKVWGSGICGTDVHIYHDEYTSYVPPLIIGHEFSAVVEEVGREVKDIDLGDHVVSDVFGHNGVMGNDVVDGAHAEYIVMPANQIHKLPENVSLREAVLLEPLVACQHGLLECVRVKPADFIVITGPGPIGIMLMQVAKLFSPAAVFITGLRRDTLRLETAKKLGADYTMYNDEGVVEKVMELTNDRGADIVLEASGADEAINQAIDMVKMGGQILNFAVYDNEFVKARLSYITWKCLTVVGSWAWLGYPEEATRKTAGALSWERAIKIMALKKIQFEPLITHEYPLTKWEEAFATCESKSGVKVILRPALEE